MDACGFRFCFTPLAGVLFTVPSRYCTLSVMSCSLPWTVVGPASHQITRVWWYSRSSSQRHAPTLRDCHPLWYAVPGTSRRVISTVANNALVATSLTTPLAQRVHAWHANGLGSSPFRSPLLRAVFRFLRVLRCFSSPTYLPPQRVPSLTLGGLPHSDTVGSLRDRHSPTLSLRIRVLHRHDMPRHPPHAHHPLPGLQLLDNTKKPVTTLTMNLFRCCCSAAYAADECDVNIGPRRSMKMLRSHAENGLREA